MPYTFLGYKNGDKFVVCAAWFGFAFANFYFFKKVYGHYNLPWDCMKEGAHKELW